MGYFIGIKFVFIKCFLFLLELYSITRAGPILPGIKVRTYTLQRLQLHMSHATLHVTNTTLCMCWQAANSQHMHMCVCVYVYMQWAKEEVERTGGDDWIA